MLAYSESRQLSMRWRRRSPQRRTMCNWRLVRKGRLGQLAGREMSSRLKQTPAPRAKLVSFRLL
eukprot:12919558-Prorocentrum_lima.AAC.1